MGPERSRTSTKPSGSIRATLTCSPSTRFPICRLRRFPEALRKLDQVLNITPDDVDTLAIKATYCPSSKATSRVLLRFSLRCIRRPTTRSVGKYKFTKRFWSAALHKSSLG